MQADADYFPSLTRRVEAIDAAALADLVQIIADAQALERDARAELDAGNYRYLADADQYELTNASALYERFYGVYGRFSEWLTKYQL